MVPDLFIFAAEVFFLLGRQLAGAVLRIQKVH